MNTPQRPHNLYLSIGSNMGDRFANLQKAVDLLFEEIGSIEKISPIYETPAMGFHGGPFLNCAVLIKSGLSAQRTLEIIHKIERSLGRKPRKADVYTSRPIDIDIIFIENEIIDSEDLTIPHPRIEDRKFVLQPLFDLESNFVHPVLNKTVDELLKITKDKSDMFRIEKILHNPTENFKLSQFNYIAIEGNIGAGKTSLATKISEDCNSKLILERYNDNPFLPKFYEDSERYAFPLEMSFLADRYQQLVDDITQYDLFKDSVISDYDISKSLIFAGITLPSEEFSLYRKLFQVMHRDLPKPDLYVYLYQNTDRLLENIKKRGRVYEQSIAPSYLQQLNSGYLEFIKSRPLENVKIIDISEMDFLSYRSDYLKILTEIIS